MMKKSKTLQLWQATLCLMTAALMLGSCGKKDHANLNYDYLPVQMSSGDSWSIIDKDGKEVVKEEYPADATNFCGGVAVVSRPNEQIRIIDVKDKTVATLNKDIKRCGRFYEEGYAVFQTVDDKQGLIDSKGHIVVQPNFAFVTNPNDGLFMAFHTESEKIHIYSIKGEMMGEIDINKYHLLNYEISEGKILVRDAEDNEGHTIVLDSKGKKLFDIKKSKEGNAANGNYLDGYLTFKDGNGKEGVANDKGEVVIRPKYELMANYGNGLFTAKKGGKFGIVNEKDETIIDFDYDDTGAYMLGDNFLVKDGNSWLLLGKDGKELTSFDVLSTVFDNYAEFVDVTGITKAIVKFYEDKEQLQTADKVAKLFELDTDKYHNRSYVSRTLDIDGMVKGDYEVWFDGSMAEEKTHQQQVNDGWFTYNQTVSDGWQWTQALPRRINGKMNIEDSAISTDDLYQSLCKQLADGRKKISDGTYSKNVKIAGKTLECRTTLTQRNQQIDYEITFNK